MSEKMRLTDHAIENVEPRTERFIVWAESYRGLGLRVTPRVIGDARGNFRSRRE